METLESLRSQIDCSQDLQSVVKTMKTLSAVNIRHYERAVDTLKQYRQILEMGLQILLRPTTGIISSLDRGRTQRQGIILFGSDQGLCGPFNQQIIHFTQSYLADHSWLDPTVITVGVRVAALFSLARPAPDLCFPIPSSVAGITPLVQDLVLAINTWQQQDQGIWMVYNQPLSSTSYRPVVEQLLPIDQAWLSELGKRSWPTRQIPTYTMSRTKLLAALIRHYLFIALYRACVGSLASENAARLVTMQNAEQTIEERITSLTASFHQQRQTEITAELLDIVAGFEALTSAADLTLNEEQ